MHDTTLNAFQKTCTGCGICRDSCQLLRESDCTPLEMAQQGVTLSEALSCSLCDACAAICPEKLSIGAVCADRRREGVDSGEFAVDEFRYLFPDRPNNLMGMYRQHHGIDYSDLAPGANTGTCFFPGCTLMTYSPGLTREVFSRLQESVQCRAIWTDCCGKLLEQLGLHERLQLFQDRLRTYAHEHEIKRIITACPGCYYDLDKVFQSSGVIIQIVYEALDFKKNQSSTQVSCTVHDSCPDRFSGLFGSQVRIALQQQGAATPEMQHFGKTTICCGSGGQLSHFRPDFVDELVVQRQAEFMQTGADCMVAYCLSCVLKYDSMPSDLPVTHALNLLLDLEPDYRGAKQRAIDMFEGPDGEQRWAAIMAD